MNVLVVESEAPLLSNIAGLVQGWGYHATAVGSGLEALSVVQRKPFDLVLLDVSLPDMDCREVILKLKETRPEIGIVTMAFESSDRLEKEIRALGIVYYMCKPISQESLKDILDHIFFKKHKNKSR
ncbi:MAG TPA: response regulator [Desulfobacteraceae bacterium]|nr:response regulator [Desulfobacteraceae bacterium]